MVRITSTEDIDKDRLKHLFQQRGHFILTPHFMELVKEILEGKRKKMEVHQCSCGELMVLSKTYADSLRKEYGTDDIPCKVCGKRKEQSLDMGILNRFEKITDFLNERYIFTTKSATTLKPKDLKILEKMALGLFPTNTGSEMLVGYFDFLLALAEHFPERVVKYKSIIKRLFDEARKKNQKEFDRLYFSLLDWEEHHKAELNIFSEEDVLEALLSKDSMEFLEENLQNRKKIDVEKARVQLQLSTYKDTAEIKIYLDILVNTLNIINGKRISADPFKTLRLPPNVKGGKARKIKSLADKIEYLDNKLHFNIASIYNTHLRNAVAHNEYEIRVKERQVRLTKYSETLTFDEFEAALDRLKDLHIAIGDYLAAYQIGKLRPQVRNQGIGALVTGYTDFFLEQGKLLPKPPCDAQLNIYQYWDFVTFEKGQRVFPEFEIRIKERDGTLVVGFGENGALYRFQKTPELVEWLEQLIVTGRLHIVLFTIAPILPKFAKKAITRVPVGKIMDVYILNFNEKTMNISPDITMKVSKLLNK